jgi:hypothetical protein
MRFSALSSEEHPSVVILRQEDTMTRLAMFTAVVAGFALSGGAPSFAYDESPWCVQASVGKSSAIQICHYRTIEQCLKERPIYGNSAFCVQNARYLPYWYARGYKPRDVR